MIYLGKIKTKAGPVTSRLLKELWEINSYYGTIKEPNGSNLHKALYISMLCR